MIALIVEREWDVIAPLEKKLRARGYEVLKAENAEEALNLCTVQDVNLVVTRSALPEISGLNLIERIVQGRKDLSISGILLLERDSNLEDLMDQKSGTSTILKKPVTEDALSHCLSQL